MPIIVTCRILLGINPSAVSVDIDVGVVISSALSSWSSKIPDSDRACGVSIASVYAWITDVDDGYCQATSIVESFVVVFTCPVGSYTVPVIGRPMNLAGAYRPTVPAEP